MTVTNQVGQVLPQTLEFRVRELMVSLANYNLPQIGLMRVASVLAIYPMRPDT
jgi:hypothetical protein